LAKETAVKINTQISTKLEKAEELRNTHMAERFNKAKTEERLSRAQERKQQLFKTHVVKVQTQIQAKLETAETLRSKAIDQVIEKAKQASNKLTKA